MPDPSNPAWLAIADRIVRLVGSLAILGLWGALRAYGALNSVDIPYVVDGFALIAAGFLFPGGLKAALQFLLGWRSGGGNGSSNGGAS